MNKMYLVQSLKDIEGQLIDRINELPEGSEEQMQFVFNLAEFDVDIQQIEQSLA